MTPALVAAAIAAPLLRPEPWSAVALQQASSPDGALHCSTAPNECKHSARASTGSRWPTEEVHARTLWPCTADGGGLSSVSAEPAALHSRSAKTFIRRQTDRHCYLERRLRLARASAAQNRAERIIPEVAGTHRSSRRTIRLRAPLRCGAPRTTSRHQRPRSRAASEGATRRRHRHPPAAAPAPPAPRAGPGRACPRR